MSTRAELVTHRPFLNLLHKTREIKKVELVVKSASTKSLKVLLKIIWAICYTEIALSAPLTKKLARYKPILKRLHPQLNKLLKSSKAVIVSELMPVLPILKLLVDPIFVAVTDVTSDDTTLVRDPDAENVGEQELQQ
jgi:hypothetical protein